MEFIGQLVTNHSTKRVTQGREGCGAEAGRRVMR